jgi:hypothetical protein
MEDKTPVLIENMEILKIRYDGQNHLIDANTYINSLIHFTTVVNEVNKELAPDKKIEIKILANDKGSFIVDMLIISQDILGQIKNVFTAENLKYGGTIATTVVNVFKLAKFLGGSKPKEKIENSNNTVTITNNYGDVKIYNINAANVYLDNPITRKAVEKQFETLDEDNSITSFDILDKDDNKLLEVPQSDFSLIGNPDSEIVSANERKQSITTTLNAITLNLDLKKKWDFIYNGHIIPAKIKDDTFKQRIDNGERFAKGDSLEVEMEIKQEFDESLKTFVNKSYTVTKILNHNMRPEQRELYE